MIAMLLKCLVLKLSSVFSLNVIMSKLALRGMQDENEKTCSQGFGRVVLFRHNIFCGGKKRLTSSD